LRLAERAVVREDVGEDPIMLLDDVLSDLDRTRAGRLVEVISRCGQAMVTATDRVGAPGDANVLALGAVR
jgi:DNA replication and repair protein RecF